MSGKNFNMVKSKKGRTIKAPVRLIAADDEAQVLTQVEMKDENAQVANRPYYKFRPYDIIYNDKLRALFSILRDFLLRFIFSK